MIPWPIAIFAAFYAAVGTSAAAKLWNLMSGQPSAGHPSEVWLAFWAVVSIALAVGFMLMKSWARRVAVWSSVLMMGGALVSAWIAAVHAQARLGFISTGVATVQLVAIRYLTRPRVREWFVQTQDARPKTQVLSPES